MTDKGYNGWAEHKRAVYTRLDNIDETNKTQTATLETQTATLKVIGDSIGDMRTELGIFKTNIKWTILIVTIVIYSIVGAAIRLIAG